MLNSYNHIISTFNWNTFLDQKEKANELQSRLSVWSGINMQKEINEVFNKLCPPDQTWRIDQLELDLGVIEMDSLESDLAHRLRMQLTEKLTDLIIYADKAGQNNIEITNQYDAPIDKLRSYLLNGVMPWNYKASDGSLNQMLSWQFQHNRQMVIAMLKEVGVTHEDVRKRMAWQMNEPNIQKTIEGFEPGNHEQITRFSNELIKVQTKENVVRAGTKDFKKNVWLWILNYLLTERGTLFNKLAFLKSSIVQMAGHYNIGYEELLQLLNEAVDEVSKSTTVKADFLLALKSLSKENSIAEVKRRFSNVPGIKIDDKTARLLADTSKSKSFVTVQTVLSGLLNGIEFTALARMVKPRISTLLLEAIVKHRIKNEAAMLEYVLEKLLFFTSSSHLGQYSLFIEKLSVDGSIPESDNTISHIKRLNTAYHEAFIKKSASKEDAQLINCLLPGGVHLMQQLVKEYSILLLPVLKNWNRQKISSNLKEIFWRTVLDYASYKGNADSFRKLFTAAVVFYLPVNKPQLKISLSKKYVRVEEHAYFHSATGEQISFTKVFLLIEQCLQAGTTTVTENGNTFTLQEMITACLEYYSATSESIHTIKVLYEILVQLLPAQPPNALIQSFCKHVLNIIKTNHGSEEAMMSLVEESFHFIINETGAEPLVLIAAMQKKGLHLTRSLQRLLKKCFPVFDIAELDALVARPSEKLLIVYRKGLMAELIQQLITDQHLPVWFKDNDEQDVIAVMHDILIHYPEKLLLVLKKESISESQMLWLSSSINVELFIRSISLIEKSTQPALTAFSKFYTALENISMPGNTSQELQQIVFRMLIRALITNNWKVISPDEVLKDLLHEISVTKNVSKTAFIRQMIEHKNLLPSVFQLSLEKLPEGVSVKPALPLKQDVSNKIRQLMKTNHKPTTKTGTPVRNAGIVLLNSYISMLFERLNLVQDKKFKEENAQEQAVHYLQYVATGMCQSEETELVLNKVLCGLPLSHPVHDSLDISDENKNLVEGLIKAAINYWSAIGDCSIDGFRGNWLVRDGLLIEHEDKWELIVEKRAYDILINHSPFSFSIIKYTWMNKPLHVSWPY